MAKVYVMWTCIEQMLTHARTHAYTPTIYVSLEMRAHSLSLVNCNFSWIHRFIIPYFNANKTHAIHKEIAEIIVVFITMQETYVILFPWDIFKRSRKFKEKFLHKSTHMCVCVASNLTKCLSQFMIVRTLFFRMVAKKERDNFNK